MKKDYGNDIHDVLTNCKIFELFLCLNKCFSAPWRTFPSPFCAVIPRPYLHYLREISMFGRPSSPIFSVQWYLVPQAFALGKPGTFNQSPHSFSQLGTSSTAKLTQIQNLSRQLSIQLCQTISFLTTAFSEKLQPTPALKLSHHLLLLKFVVVSSVIVKLQATSP